MPDRIDVFISSTSRDLQAFRDAVAKVILRLGAYPIDMATFNATDRNALQLCYDKVQEAEVFIGIYAHRYGYAPGPDVTCTAADGTTLAGDSETSITHWEYRWAVERGLPLLLFVVDEDAPWSPKHIDDEPGKSRLNDFKELILGQHVVGFFRSPDHLTTQVATALAETIAQHQSTEAASAFGAPRRRDFYKHVALPPNYVPRTDLLAELRLALLGDESVAFTSAIQGATALHGMGGIGKSVMARALCDDPAVQAAFPDGILWTTLGQEPNLTVKLREWVTALGGTISEHAPTEDTLKAKLAELLDERACLLVVDDVWQKRHAEAFRVGGENCRLLLTTRDAEVARGIGVDVQPIPTMSTGEALELLREWAGGSLDDADAETLTTIINRLGRLPLAIKLAGAQLQRKSPEKWLERFDARKLKAKRPDDVHDSLELTFGLSLDELEDTERRLYATLAIFKEDEPIHERAIARLWSALDEFDADDTEELIDDLAARALVEVVGEAYPRAAVLHDLMRDFIAAELDDPQAAHVALLNAYRETRTDDGWHTAQDDGYLFDHLAFHLFESGEYVELRALFVDQQWMNVRFEQDGYTYNGYIRDLMIAWENVAHPAVLTETEPQDGPSALTDCVCYALIRTSINSLAANYIPELVARAVETGLWSAERALAIAERVPDAKQRAKFCTLLLQTSQLTDLQRQHAQMQGLAAALTIDYEVDRARALAALVPQLDDTALRAGLDAVLAISHGSSRANVLAVLAPQLSGDLLRAGLDAALAIDDEGNRVHALAALAPHLDDVERKQALRAGLGAALAIGREWERARVLAALTPHFTGGLLRTALDAALAISSEGARVHALAALAPQLDQAERQQTLRAGLDASLAISYEGFPRAVALATLAPQLSDSLLRTALDAALAISYEGARVHALAALAPQLDQAERQQILHVGLDAALVIGDESTRANALIALAPQLTGDLLRIGLDAALTISNEAYRADALAALTPQFSGDLLRAGLDAALAISNEVDRARALATLAPQLSEDLLRKGLDAALAISHEGVRARALRALAPQLDEMERQQALRAGLDAALALDDNKVRTRALAALAPQLDGDLLRTGLDTALVLGDERICNRALAVLTWQLEKAERQQASHAGSDAAPALGDTGARARTLKALTRQLDEGEREQALRTRLDAALASSNEGRLAFQLMSLAPRLSGDLLHAGLEATLALDDEEHRARGLVALAPQLSGDLLRAGLDAALVIGDERARATVLAALAPQLSGDLLCAGLDAALVIGNKWDRARALVAFLPVAPDPVRIIAEVRTAATEHLLAIFDEKRESLLKFCAEKKVFTTPIFSQNELTTITDHIIEICNEWMWQ